MIFVRPDHRDTAAAGCDDRMLCVHQRAHGFDLHDLHGLRARNDLTPAATCVFSNVDTLFCCQLLCLFLGHERADGLGRMLEGRVFGVDGNLRENGRAVDAETAAVQLLTDHVLQIVTDIALAHGDADGKRHNIALCLLLVVGGKGVLNHTDLRSVAVGDDDLVTVFDQIGDCFCGDMDSVHLLMQIFAQRVAAEGDDNSFSHFQIPHISIVEMAGARLPPFEIASQSSRRARREKI